ncbi:DNA polymerase III subunit gamma tau [Ligilactobacillus hayakitensis DSM 18933 = JCM 14209]|uniref:DNA-directed DNA polymerase n=1 Tax=Ligilactobacillus hayakitensis DSM 18933 = JCM 14209 TaxID=1423755 RepID=A0A0R1WT02_9LACO|nr:DNA polymerase III subunit gamma/tau [Ligilactobacillus hayakitensis]KRM18310.1 DNA polymerase III subunit gamma tau [Ligilactobacillus hayakitensis DSM 18933 = JCM 14209]
MSYQALYRVWRPQKFDDLVGQEMVVKTLKNAIATKQTSHAYLFCGPRGTGKTSAAKIFAKAINCKNQVDGEPCNQCEICTAITEGRLNDVIEIDAASNNGVEEIRDIRDKVKYAPTQAEYKVYIIDEVHMLSTGAFNALLKTLEEPPANVVFILATTEPHKIPATIISRTQRFDFKRITSKTIIARMKFILDEKQVEYDEKALKVIAYAAEGGMRDALSILDQTISFGDNDVTVDNALLVTGSVTQENIIKYLQEVVNRNTKDALETIHEIIESGKDANRLIEDLINYSRNILLYKQSPESLNELPTEEFKNLSEQVSSQQLYQIIDELNQQQENMRFSSHQSIYLEVLTVKLTQQTQTETKQVASTVDNTEVEMLMRQVKQLQQQVSGLKKELQTNRTQVSNIPARQGSSASVARKNAQREVSVNIAKVVGVLNNATRAALDNFKQNWPDLMQMLSISQRAIMHVSQPVAASEDAVVVSFEYDYLCQKAMEDQQLVDTIENGLDRLTGKVPELVFIPASKWPKIRQDYLSQRKNQPVTKPAAEEPVIQEESSENEINVAQKAQELFGNEIVEIKND